MIYDMSDFRFNKGKYYGETDISKVHPYFIYGKVSNIFEKIDEIILSNKSEYLCCKCNGEIIYSLKYKDCYVLEIESNEPDIPIIKNVIYSVSEKRWML